MIANDPCPHCLGELKVQEMCKNSYPCHHTATCNKCGASVTVHGIGRDKCGPFYTDYVRALNNATFRQIR